MSSFPRKLWTEMKNRGETIGLVFIILGVVVLLVLFGLALSGLQSGIGLLGASLGLLSVGLGFIAIGMAAKSDKRHTDLLLKVLDQFEPKLDKIEPPKEQIVSAKPIAVVSGIGDVKVTRMDYKSKEAAQQRLDEDTKRVGYVRGEIYQLKDGSWGIHWGGKYPL